MEQYGSWKPTQTSVTEFCFGSMNLSPQIEGVCIICEPASHASQHASHASQQASHASQYKIIFLM